MGLVTVGPHRPAILPLVFVLLGAVALAAGIVGFAVWLAGRG